MGLAVQYKHDAFIPDICLGLSLLEGKYRDRHFLSANTDRGGSRLKFQIVGFIVVKSNRNSSQGCFVTSFVTAVLAALMKAYRKSHVRQHQVKPMQKSSLPQNIGPEAANFVLIELD